MQLAFPKDKIVKAIFMSEIKNRFLCEVSISGMITRCYVPSSCRLDNLLDLIGKEVLLTATTSRFAKTPYSLLAIAYKKNYIILNSSLANYAVGQALTSRRFACLGKRKYIQKEIYVDNYKCDFFIRDTETLIEVKSIISTDLFVKFPSVFSLRAINQLQAIKKHLKEGKSACYIIVSLNPYVKAIVVDKQTPFYQVFAECLSLGMRAMGVACQIKDNQLSVRKTLEVMV